MDNRTEWERLHPYGDRLAEIRAELATLANNPDADRRHEGRAELQAELDTLRQPDLTLAEYRTLLLLLSGGPLSDRERRGRDWVLAQVRRLEATAAGGAS